MNSFYKSFGVFLVTLWLPESVEENTSNSFCPELFLVFNLKAVLSDTHLLG